MEHKLQVNLEPDLTEEDRENLRYTIELEHPEMITSIVHLKVYSMHLEDNNV